MLYNENCIKVMNSFDSKIIDVIIADPPYFLSNDGVSIKNGKIVSVNKGDWDKVTSVSSKDEFNRDWLKAAYRILKDEGTIWITGTYHNIFSVYDQMVKVGFKVINIVIWRKTDPPPLIYINKFRFSYEFLIWARKSKKYKFNDSMIKGFYENSVTDIWEIPAVGMGEKSFGYHPTQKPEKLMERIILTSSVEEDLILDPFMGSGTTGYCAYLLNRRFIGIEKSCEYFNIAKNRISFAQNIQMAVKKV